MTQKFTGKRTNTFFFYSPGHTTEFRYKYIDSFVFLTIDTNIHRTRAKASSIYLAIHANRCKFEYVDSFIFLYHFFLKSETNLPCMMDCNHPRSHKFRLLYSWWSTINCSVCDQVWCTDRNSVLDTWRGIHTSHSLQSDNLKRNRNFMFDYLCVPTNKFSN